MFSSTAAFVAGFACLAAMSAQVRAYPTYLQADVSTFVPGGPFGSGGIITIEAGTGDACKIVSDIPSAGFTVGETYTFVISTDSSHTTVGGVKGLGMVYSFDSIPPQFASDSSGMLNTGTSKTVSWVASGETVTASALCGAMGSYKKMHVAAKLTFQKGTIKLLAHSEKRWLAL